MIIVRFDAGVGDFILDVLASFTMASRQVV